MATTIAKLTKIAGAPDVFGGKGAFVGFYTGPTSYQGGVGGGDLIIPFGGTTELAAANVNLLRSILCIPSVVDTTGTYRIEGGPFGGTLTVGTAPRQWAMRWITISTGAEVTNATNLSTLFTVLTIIGQ